LPFIIHTPVNPTIHSYIHLPRRVFEEVCPYINPQLDGTWIRGISNPIAGKITVAVVSAAAIVAIPVAETKEDGDGRLHSVAVRLLHTYHRGGYGFSIHLLTSGLVPYAVSSFVILML